VSWRNADSRIAQKQLAPSVNLLTVSKNSSTFLTEQKVGHDFEDTVTERDLMNKTNREQGDSLFFMNPKKEK
jgi:hypothetical protein